MGIMYLIILHFHSRRQRGMGEIENTVLAGGALVKSIKF